MFLFFFSSTFLLFEFGASFDNGFDSIGCLVFLFWRFLSPFPASYFFGLAVPAAQLSSAHKVSNCASTVLSAYGFLVSVSLFDVRSFHSKQGHFLFFSPAEPSAIIPMADIIAYTCL
jgi:hypothetical protein